MEKLNLSLQQNQAILDLESLARDVENRDPMRVRYLRLGRMLHRTVSELAKRLHVLYSSQASYIDVICKERSYPQRASLQVLRRHVAAFMKETFSPTEEDYLYDVKAMAEAISFFFRVTIPTRLLSLLPDTWRKLDFQPDPHRNVRFPRLRMTVTQWSDCLIYGEVENWEGGECVAAYTHLFDNASLMTATRHLAETFAGLRDLLFVGAQVNLLDVSLEPWKEDSSLIVPELVVFEPDFLVDITAITGCIQPYGNSPLNHILHKIQSAPQSSAIMLGNVANQFLDDCVNQTDDHPITYEASISKAFVSDPITFCALEDINAEFFAKTKEQFDNINRTVTNSFEEVDIQPGSGVVLEPSFICEAMGMQGRMDLLSLDHGKIVELKSGKAEDWNRVRPEAKEEHLLQVTLYYEFLHYNLGLNYSDVKCFLFYSRYPQMMNCMASRDKVRKALQLRNDIVGNEWRLMKGESRNLAMALTPERLNTRGISGKLWDGFIFPALSETLNPLWTADAVELSYFHTFLSFVERELFLTKVGCVSTDRSSGFSDAWNLSVEEKVRGGNMIVDLTIDCFNVTDGLDVQDNGESIRNVRLKWQADEENLPNFRVGDLVMLYERNQEGDSVTNKQLFRCTIESLLSDEVVLRLAYKQRNRSVFPLNSRYAMEHDTMTSTYNSMSRALRAFLTAPQDRRDLLLGRRELRFAAPAPLPRPTEKSERVNQVVTDAMRAEDFYLLVGPPGTGKTNLAMRTMVDNFLAEPASRILLMAYTNRAVDEICRMLQEYDPDLDYIRIGNELNCEPAFRPHLMKYQMAECKNRNLVKNRLFGCRVYVATVASMDGKSALFDLFHFDVAIVDEASQILEPQILGLLSAKTTTGASAIRKFVMIGDHKQLPAVVQQPREEAEVEDPALRAFSLENCADSLFERLHRYMATHGEVKPGLLDTQWRMHPTISSFVSREFYNNALKVGRSDHQTSDLLPYAAESETRQVASFPLNMEYTSENIREFVRTVRMGFLHTKKTSRSDNNKINAEEANVVAEIVRSIIELNAENPDFSLSAHVGIIVPFRNQIAIVLKRLRELGVEHAEEIVIDTVERLQGGQKDYIIFSTTVSQYYQLSVLSEPVEIENQWVDRKLNVALTRARKQLFVVGDEELLRQSSVYERLIDYCAGDVSMVIPM
ncbi:MAG: AAA domain-containing protein [Paludibacteraceae bacterium]|nr:AAA domain-containing protein [Paludibacteraceae bacterium]